MNCGQRQAQTTLPSRPLRDKVNSQSSIFLHVILGSIATSLLGVRGVNPVLASSGATILYLLVAFALHFKGQQPSAVFCGSFAGMTSFWGFFERAPFNPGLALSIYLCIAIVTGLLYVSILRFEHKLPKRLFSGYGGRLGAIAFIGSVACLLISGLLIHLVLNDFQVVVLKDSTAFGGRAPLAMILVSAAGSLLTRILATYVDSTVPGLNVVLSASVCGLVGGIFLPSLFPLGAVASLYWYAGTFAGMSSTSILDSHRGIFLAGAITGVFLAGLHHYGSGAGGVLGFSAFLAVIVLKSVAEFVNRNKANTTTHYDLSIRLSTGRFTERYEWGDDSVTQNQTNGGRCEVYSHGKRTR